MQCGIMDTDDDISALEEEEEEIALLSHSNLSCELKLSPPEPTVSSPCNSELSCPHTQSLNTSLEEFVSCDSEGKGTFGLNLWFWTKNFCCQFCHVFNSTIIVNYVLQILSEHCVMFSPHSQTYFLIFPLVFCTLLNINSMVCYDLLMQITCIPLFSLLLMTFSQCQKYFDYHKSIVGILNSLMYNLEFNQKN